MKKVSLSLVVALNMLTSLYAENNATASTPENLGTIEVQDTQKLRRDDRDYEARKLVKSTTRLDLTARETPQSLTVVTEAKLKDMGITDYQVLMRNIAGITSGRMDERLYPTARGFSIDYYLLDSMPSFGGFSLGANDLNLLPYERVEVVKGANGLLAGAGNPAASLNFIRKHADSTIPKGYISLNGGSYDKYGLKTDVQSPLNQSGSVRGRLAFMHERSHSYMDYYNRRNTAVYGVLDIDVTDDSRLSFGSFYQTLRRHGTRWGGMPAFNSDGTRTHFGKNKIFSQPWTRYDISTLDFYADFKQYFSNEASLSLSYSFRRAHTDSNLLYYGGRVGPGGIGNVADLSVYANKREENIHNIDAYVNIPYEFFEQDHEFVFGVMYNLYKKGSDNVSSYWNNRNTPAGLAYAARTRINFNDLHIEDPRLPYVDQNNADRTIQKAIYAANKLSITEDLKLLLGTRMSYYKYKITGGADNRNFTREITPYAGITYDLDDHHTLYASYTSIFKPQTYKDKNNKYLDPIQGKDYEAGIKGEYFDGDLQASLGVFKIIQDKLGIRTDEYITGTNSYAYRQGRGVTSRGFEADVNGKITDALSLSMGLAHYKAKDADGNIYASDSSRTSANLFAKYEIGTFRIGAGAMYRSKIYSDSPYGRIEQKAYTIANVMLGYKASKNLDVQLNVDNITDKRYFEGIGSNRMIYGDPRTFNLSLTYSF